MLSRPLLDRVAFFGISWYAILITGAIVIGLAAVIIGEVIFGKIFRNFALKLTAAVIGAIIYYIVMNFVLRMGLSTDDLKLLTALVVAVFLTIPYWKGKYFTKVPVKKGGKDNA